MSSKSPKKPVGIIGAGVAGMYVGLMLQSLGIEYEILEASDRAGGRIETYRFPPDAADNLNGTHDYYDLGAMRFPNTEIMHRTFNLFNYPPINEGVGRVSGMLIPYLFDTQGGNSFSYFNNQRHRGDQLGPQQQGNDPFRAAEVGVAPQYIAVGVRAILNDVIAPFVQRLQRDLQDGTRIGWDLLMAHGSHSARSYMCNVYRTPAAPANLLGQPLPALAIPDQPLPTNVVNWLETFDKSTGWYDRALATTVLEEMAFGNGAEYWCLDEGSEVLTQAMHEFIQVMTGNQGILLNHRVTQIAVGGQGITVDGRRTIDGGGVFHREYPHVISTVTLPCLRHTINIDGANLNPLQSNALRQLQYTSAVKVGVKFRTRWWDNAQDVQGNPLNIIGGRSFTDRSIRVVVYPSYGLDQLADNPAVLIASYVWTDDAARIGALIGSQDPNADQQLIDLVLRDLAVVHNVDLVFLQDQYVAHHAVDWAHNPLTMGAFALFGPGKFENLYTHLTYPAGGGRLHFAGEAVSPRHGWIVGALDSAWRCVAEYLISTDPGRLQEFHNLWGVVWEWFNEFGENLLIEHLVLFAPEVFGLQG